MNKGFKRVLTVSIILIFLGIALLTGSIVASKGDFKTISNAFEKFGVYLDGANSVETTKTLTMNSTLSNVNLTFINSDITVTTSEDEKVHVSYEKRKNYAYSENFSNDNLIINESAPWLFNFSMKRTKVNIQLPQTTHLSDLILKNVSGLFQLVSVTANHIDLSGVDTSATITRCESSLSLNFSSVNGGLDLLSSNINDINLKTVNGSFNIPSTTFNNLSINTTNGDSNVALSGNKDDYKIDFGTVNGSFNFDNNIFKGSTVLTGNQAAKSITFKAVNGNLTLKSIE
ncbi:MAG: DUF4097 family beta strand repeat-containing protein [Bacillota bacterium]